MVEEVLIISHKRFSNKRLDKHQLEEVPIISNKHKNSHRKYQTSNRLRIRHHEYLILNNKHHCQFHKYQNILTMKTIGVTNLLKEIHNNQDKIQEEKTSKMSP